MNREIYRYVLKTYGRLPLFWIGCIAELVRSFFLRVWVVVIMASLAKDIASGNVDTARDHALLFLGIYAIGAIVGSIGDLISVHAENNIEYPKLSEKFYLKLTGKDMTFYRDHQAGYLVSLYRQHLDSLLLLSRFFRIEVIRSVVALLAPTLVLFSYSWRLGLITLAIVVVQVVYIIWSSSRANIYRVHAHEAYRKASGDIADNITNMIAFKSNGSWDYHASGAAQLSLDEANAYWERFKMRILLDLPRDLITALGVTGAFFIILSNAQGQPQAVGLIVLTLTYLFQLVRTVGDVPELIMRHDDLVTKIGPTLRYLSPEYETIKDPKLPKDFKVTKGSIVLDHVSFDYVTAGSDKAVPVFKDLSVHVKGGQRVGIVGLSGAGKSTFASLLMRFDDVKGGSIKIDGTDIRDVKQNDLRAKISYVPQEPLLFHRTIKENISYFNSSATDADIERAARAAYAHDFIMQLPDGYASMVGERGVKLSGGQKQRIVIARAILKGAPIMIFDEATSALDTESEKIIQEALPAIIGKHTAIVIAHRLSTIASLDRILVMHDGEIIEDGTHDELLEKGGRYYSLWQKQVAGHTDH